MSQYIKTDAWKIVEDRFLPSRVKASESLMSLGNGVMGQRANFEEHYSGDTFRGSYIGGIHCPEKSSGDSLRNDHPEYFAKVLNSAFWIGIRVLIDFEELDLASAEVLDFHRELDMRHGLLVRRFRVRMRSGIVAEVEAVRFLSLVRTQLGAISYSVTTDRDADVRLTPFIDADVWNEDARYDEKFWLPVSQNAGGVTMRTKTSGFEVCWHQRTEIAGAEAFSRDASRSQHVASQIDLRVQAGQTVTLYKYVGIASSLNHAPETLASAARDVAQAACGLGFAALLAEQCEAWEQWWRKCDIEIEGDQEAQQGIRFSIFHLLQAYTGEDARLNVSPKGFAGERYDGGAYGDTEIYCQPFYLAAAGEQAARQLLDYRYSQLDRAIAHAGKLGFREGAALFPAGTADREYPGEWRTGSGGIHRNGAVAYSIYNYIRYTGRMDYLCEGGLEMLIAVARFWALRSTFSEERGQYVILGVTGPNGYESRVDNNWYTNYLAAWCLRYARQAADWIGEHRPAEYVRIVRKCRFDYGRETDLWLRIAGNMRLPGHAERGIFLQQEGYLDKEQALARDLDPAERPLNGKWSRDRILRSCFLRQADVLQGIYLFEDDFDQDTIRSNFRFYEPRTVHESPLSPGIHAVLAARTGDHAKAYEMYLRVSRLDLDDCGREVEEGLHTAGMAGSWLSVVEGFGGMRVRDGRLHFDPAIPPRWKRFSFRISFRGSIVRLSVTRCDVELRIERGPSQTIFVGNAACEVSDLPVKVRLAQSGLTVKAA